ncbi:MAG: LOG family protein [Zetaproteobacteria bacterium]|nr:LOG family protein [Zetaproteobacteria bacterium]
MRDTSNRPRLTAFGASSIGASHPIFQDVIQLSESIAKAGWDGQIGGHQGMMSAFSQGMVAGGGHARGITLECFPTPPENSLSEEIRTHDFFTRMQQLIEDCDAWIVLPGGLGTLAELAMTWDLLAIRMIQERPLILYGDMWPPILDTLNEHLYVSVNSIIEHAQCCTKHDEVLTILNDNQYNDV